MIEAVDFSRDATALITEDKRAQISYRDLGEKVRRARDSLSKLPKPAVVFIFSGNCIGGIVAYLACLAEGLVVGFGEPGTVVRDRVIAAYAPTALVLQDGIVDLPEGYRVAESIGNDQVLLWQKADKTPYPVAPHGELALLLSTSGSTGAAKFVRLSRRALLSNARAIGKYLGIGESDRAMQSLPIHYSYGLSILNSHLVAGASVVLTGHSFMKPEFWKLINEVGCSSFAGVPYMYETLCRLRFRAADCQSIKTFTQAGGHLKSEMVHYFRRETETTRSKLFVMYGQTEATARIAYVPPEMLEAKVGSIGIPIPGGELWLEAIDGDTNMRELCYRGANVMLGYATKPEDLSLGDEQHGVLRTGDLGECDADGFYFIRGRLARFAKLFGKRINLVDIEMELETAFKVDAAATEMREAICVFVEGGGNGGASEIRLHLAQFLALPPATIKVAVIDRLPRTSSGKKDYAALR